jgi:uncharacterized glyoxalase superfamily protein PhnB
MQTNRSAPPATVTPVLVYPDVRAAVAWLETAFGFEERVRIGETHRAQLRVGLDGAVVVADVGSERVAPGGGGWTHLVKVRVADVDAAFARACDQGRRSSRSRGPGSTASDPVCWRTSRPSLGS